MTSLGTIGSVLLLASLGLIMGALSLTGWLSTPVEFGAWVLVGAVWIGGGATLGLTRPVRTLLIVGVLAGVFTGGIQGALAGTLVENNQAYAENLEEPVDGEARLQLFAAAVGIGLAWGLAFGLAAWGLARTGAVDGWGI